jgi:sodium transport system permease protein
MRWATVRVLFLHEIRTLLRDRRAVFLSIVLPLLVTPMILLAASATERRRQRTLEETVFQYAVTGPWTDELRSILKEAGGGEPPFRMAEAHPADAAAALRNREIHLHLQALTGDAADAEKPPATAGAGPRREVGVPLVRIYFQANRDASRAGRDKFRDLLDRARRARSDAALHARGFPVDSASVFAVDDTDVATPAEVTGSRLGRYLTLLLLMMMLTGGATAALDILAGEKERGTLETLLATAAGRAEIVAAKQLVILAVALTITLIQIANILAYVTLRLIPLAKDFVIEAPPATLAALLLLFVPTAVLVSAVLLMVSGYAKSYKEAQLYFFPVYLLSLVPALAAALPGIRLRSAIVLVPLANVSVAVREVMVGRHDWPMILLAAAAMALAAAGMLRASGRMLSSERLVTAGPVEGVEEAGGPALFPRRVLRWYALMWVALLVGPGALGLSSLRGQTLVNQLVIFLLLPLLMIRRYRLPAREALSLRGAPPLAWLAALLAIPSGHLAATGVFRLSNQVFPVPSEVLEQFSRAVMPPDVPAWQLVVLLAVLPGVCEEIAFRGTLLHGLRGRLSPAAQVAAVAVIFGLFHQSLFRIAPTAFLGALLALIVLWTRSILPAMLVHAGNNGFALWAAREGLPLGDLPAWLYLAGAAALALSLFLLYRTRADASP